MILGNWGGHWTNLVSSGIDPPAMAHATTTEGSIMPTVKRPKTSKPVESRP